jgi:Flp pilus assembly pilin Flp
LVALIAAVIVLAVLGLGVVVHNSFQQTCNSLEDPGPMSTADADCTK